MILAPNEMKAEPDERKAAKICLEKIALDPEWYRIGHTKARNSLISPPTTVSFFSYGGEIKIDKVRASMAAGFLFKKETFLSLRSPPPKVSPSDFETTVWPRI